MELLLGYKKGPSRASYLVMFLIHLGGRVMALLNGEFVGIALNHELKRRGTE